MVVLRVNILYGILVAGALEFLYIVWFEINLTFCDLVLWFWRVMFVNTNLDTYTSECMLYFDDL